MNIEKLNHKQGSLLVILAGILWSTVGVAVKSMEEANAFQILFYRSFSLTIFIGIVTYILFNKQLISLIYNIKSYVLGGLCLFFAYLGGIYSLQHTSAANALILFACAPIITAVLSAFILKEKTSKVTVISIALALLGVLIMVWNDFGNSNFRGNLAAIGSAFGFSLFAINLRHNKAIEMLPSVFASGVLGVLFTFWIIYFSEVGFTIPKNDIMIAVSMGVFQVGSGLVLFTMGSKVVPATQLTILSLGEVFFGPFWVWLAIGEEIFLNTIFGGFLICCAVIFNGLYTRPLDNN